MDVTEFRRSFSLFAGPDRYCRFVRAVNNGGRWRGRFLFWQEDLLARFADVTDFGEVAFKRVEPLLRICEMHEVELAPDTEALSQRCRGAVSDYTRAQLDHFPNTDCGPIVTGNSFDNFRRGLWYCPICRAAETKWKATAAQ